VNDGAIFTICDDAYRGGVRETLPIVARLLADPPAGARAAAPNIVADVCARLSARIRGAV
jgi:hypothetical protein